MKPILFNTDMVRAILEGRKTVTRRVVKLPSNIQVQDNGLYTLYAEGTCYENQHIEELEQYLRTPYEVGDVLYVRETWTDHYVPNEEGKAELQYCYKADGIDIKAECLPGENNRWYPSIHMPKAAARIFLRVTSVRVERLRNVTTEDMEKEGLIDFCKKCKALFSDCDTCLNEDGIESEFTELWDSTIKPDQLKYYGWEANPYVWVIEFERIEKSEAAVQKGATLNVRE